MKRLQHSGIPVVDGCLSGPPAGQLTVVLGGPRTGKTVFAFGALAGALRRGESVCYVTADEPARVVAGCAEHLALDLRPALRDRQLTLLAYGPSFHSKLGAVRDVRPALAELDVAARARGARTLILDSADPLSSIGEGARARALTRGALDCLRQMGLTCVVTVDPGALGAIEWRASAPWVLELSEHQGVYSLQVHRSPVAEVMGRKVPLVLVAGHGLGTTRQTDSARPAAHLDGERESGTGRRPRATDEEAALPRSLAPAPFGFVLRAVEPMDSRMSDAEAPVPIDFVRSRHTLVEDHQRG